jgi:Gluconate 2-dehydrogenase subunit 3
MSSGFREPGHLPNLRPDRQPAAPGRLPRQRVGVTPQMYGRYPDYDVLTQAPHWDEVTRRLVLDRVEKVPDIRFFSDAEARTLGVFCDLVLAQEKEPRVPVLNMIDAKLFAGQLDGFRYADMPDDRETWRRVAKGLDAAARQHGSDEFATAPWTTQCQVIEALSQGSLHGQVWDELPAKRAWSVVMRTVLSEFYSHPWAWNEIGFGGPAYPRGYARFGVGQREHWESGPALDADPVRER